jgi:hypothetical protein
MSEPLKGIVEHFRLDDPENADTYTEEWARQRCAKRNTSPEAYMAFLEGCTATSTAQADITAIQPGTKTLPEHYHDKLSGPVDGLSYQIIERGLIKLPPAGFSPDDLSGATRFWLSFVVRHSPFFSRLAVGLSHCRSTCSAPVYRCSIPSRA